MYTYGHRTLELSSVLMVAMARHEDTSVWLGEESDHGYLVGIRGHGAVLRAESGKTHPVDELIDWVESAHRVESAATLGIWHNDEMIYLDASAHYADLEVALDVARRTGEIAIWDLENGREIRAIPEDK